MSAYQARPSLPTLSALTLVAGAADESADTTRHETISAALATPEIETRMKLPRILESNRLMTAILRLQATNLDDRPRLPAGLDHCRAERISATRNCTAPVGDAGLDLQLLAGSEAGAGDHGVGAEQVHVLRESCVEAPCGQRRTALAWNPGQHEQWRPGSCPGCDRRRQGDAQRHSDCLGLGGSCCRGYGGNRSSGGGCRRTGRGAGTRRQLCLGVEPTDLFFDDTPHLGRRTALQQSHEARARQRKLAALHGR